MKHIILCTLFFISFLGCKKSSDTLKWTAVINGLPYGTNVHTLAIQGNKIYAGTSGGVYLSINNCNSWTSVNNGLTKLDVFTLAFQDSNIYAGTWRGGVYLLIDNGSSWIPVNNGLWTDSIRSYELAIQGNNIFAGTWGGGVYLSSNNGSSWTPVNNGLPANTFVRTLAIQGNNIYAGEIYAGTDYGQTWGLGVYVSSNNGSSWTTIGLSDYVVYSLAFQGNNILAGTANGVYLSSNN